MANEVFALRNHFHNIGDCGAYYPIEGHADGILASLRNSMDGMERRRCQVDTVGAPIFSKNPEQVSADVADQVAQTGILSQ